MREFNHFYKTIRFLKKNLPLEKEISVRRTKLPHGLDGDCRLKNDKFYIRIDKTLPENYAIDVATHEIAHCLSWNHEFDEHGDSWGKAYSIVYRKFLEMK
jgi:hypothetical protein